MGEETVAVESPVTNDIISAVDGERTFVRDNSQQVDKPSKSEKKSSTKSVEPDKAPNQVSQGQVAEETDPLALAEKLLAPEPENKDANDLADGLDEDEQTDGQKPKEQGRAARTIQSLRSRAQQAERERESVKQQTMERERQWQQWASEQQARQQAYIESMRAELYRLQKQQEQPKLDPNDPEYAVKKFKEDLRQELAGEWQKKHLAPLQNELEKFRKEQQQRQQEAERAKISAQYNQHADYVANQLMAGFSEEAKNKMRRALGTLTLTAAYGYKSDPQTAGKQLQRFILDYAREYMRAQSKASKERRNASQSAGTPPSNRAAGGAKGTPLPSSDDTKGRGSAEMLDSLFSHGFIRSNM